MKILLRVVLVLALLAAGVLVVGLLLPEEHTAAVEARYRATPDEIYAIVADVEGAPAWRGELQRVEVLSREGEPLRWREVSDWGTLTFVREVDEPGRRITSRIVDEGQGFGGTWTWEIEGDDAGTTLRITEAGEVSNPLYRVMSLAMGHHAGMEAYARDLGARLGESVTPVRR